MNVDPGNNPHQMLTRFEEELMAPSDWVAQTAQLPRRGQPPRGVQLGNSTTMKKSCQES